MTGENGGNDKPEGKGPWFAPVVTAVVTATLGVGLAAGIEACNRAREAETEAENTARVLDQNLRAADEAMERSITDGRYRFYDLKLNMPLDDQKRLAEELGDDYDVVAEAISAYRLQFARAGEKHEFVQDDVVQLACNREKVALGRRALVDLAETPADDLPELGGYEKACRTEVVELVAERFYDSFVDGNGRSACDRALASEEAREMMRKESPSCDEVIPRPEHSPDLHPHANAVIVELREDLLSATVHLLAAEDRVGVLKWTDGDGDNVWHLEEVQNLEAVKLPQDARKLD
jgi:hypothetical protein